MFDGAEKENEYAPVTTLLSDAVCLLVAAIVVILVFADLVMVLSP